MMACLAVSAPVRAQITHAAPQFTLQDSQGSLVSLADFRDRIVYVDFWASWCAPCAISFPVMESLQQRYASQGFTVLAINLDQNRQDATAYLADRSVSFPILFDVEGLLPDAYGIRGMPTSFLVDERGQIVYKHEGFRKGDGAVIESKLRELLESINR